MSSKYLNDSGLAYFWSKIKAWCNSLFALDSAAVHKTGNEIITGTKIFSNTISGSIDGNAATATKLGTSTVGSSVQPIYLNAGTATAVDSALKTCYGGVESEAVENTYFKIGRGSITGAYNHLKVQILVQHITGKDSCIWDVWLSTGSTAGVYSQGHSILFNSTGYYGANLIVAYKFNSGGNLDFELYVKETARYSNHRFTVIQECWRNNQKVGNILTLYNQLTTTGTAAITSGYTALTTTKVTVNMNISGNAATATKLATARTINGVSFDGSANITISDSTKLPLDGGIVTGTITAASGAAFNQRHSSYIKGDSYSSNVYMGQGWYDKNGTGLADILYFLNTPANDGNAWVGFRLWGNPNHSSSVDAYLGVMITPSGETFATCSMSASASDNSDKVATTAWVKNAAVDKSGDTMTGTLTISNTLPLYYLRNTNVTKGTVPSATQWSQIIFFGNTGSDLNDRMGFIEQETRSDGWSILRLASCKNIANTFDYAWLSIDAPNDSEKRGYVNFSGIYKDQALVNNDFSIGTNPSSTTWWSFANSCRNDWLSGMWAWTSSTGQSQIEFRVRGNSTSLIHKEFWIYQNLDGSSEAGIDTNSFRPTLNTFSTLGIAGTGRWGQIYSTSATINTSDERQKCDIEAIPDDVLDAWETCEFYQYRMKDSVNKKGENARYHTGMIAQRLDKKFKDANENLNRYGLFCYDEWDDIEARKDEKDNIIEPAVEAGNEYSLRYEEALCMEAAYQRRENARLKKRIADLEERLAMLELKIA